MSDNVTVLLVETPTHGRVLLRAAASTPPRGLLVGFHGYGENAERHLADLESIPGSGEWVVASVQGLHRFYRYKSNEVAASWMTREDRELAIADNVAYVDRVVALVRRGQELRRLVFVGFSQGVAMAFRAALLGASAADGVIALGGDVPPDFRTVPHRPFPPLLLARGTGDAWYTTEKLEEDLAFLRSEGAALQTCVFEGGHEWTAAFRDAAGAFLRSLPPDQGSGGPS